MLDGILDLVKGEVLGAIDNAGVPAEKKEAAVETTASTIMNGLKDHFTPDNLSAITNLFGGGADAGGSSMVNSIQSSVVSALVSKVGLSQGVASAIASTAVSAVMSLISKKSNDSNDSFSLQSLVESFAGSNKGGLLGTLGHLFGK
ncbi:MAG: DUF937 domain-containing protein [Dysgonomonas sp.]|nr:DUF937 domain-containing protein [Dysgonomonas sp.]